MKRRKQLPGGPADDRGAALLLVLVVVTVVALAGAALLSFSDTSIRTTVALRDQGAVAYAAEGAAQVAISELEKTQFPADCVGGTGVALGTSGNAFYSPPTSGSLNAYVWCSPDEGEGGNAILTLGTGIGGEDGIEINSSAGPVQVRGGVFSNSTIDIISSGGLKNTRDNPPYLPYTLARGVCSKPTLITPTAYRMCNYAAVDPRGTDPGTPTPHGASYDSPAAPAANGTIGTCGGSAKYQQLTPGRYTSATDLNNVTGCSKKLVHFLPGTYFFDFTNSGSHIWKVDHTYIVAGTPTISLTKTPKLAQMATACVTPMAAAATTSSGVRFVFGGDSQLQVSRSGNQGGQVTICASKSADGPPIAISGQKTALGGSFPVGAQSGCIIALPPATRCPLIYTDQSSKKTLTIQGATYTPKAWVHLSLNESTNQVFRGGLVVRALTIDANGSSNLSSDVIEVPNLPAIMYLSVYVCPGTATCSAAGTPRLRAKVQLDTSVPRPVTVLSWSVQR